METIFCMCETEKCEKKAFFCIVTCLSLMSQTLYCHTHSEDSLLSKYPGCSLGKIDKTRLVLQTSF